MASKPDLDTTAATLRGTNGNLSDHSNSTAHSWVMVPDSGVLGAQQQPDGRPPGQYSLQEQQNNARDTFFERGDQRIKNLGENGNQMG